MPKKRMDQSEKWARDYLEYRGFRPEDVVFEPDGNVPPDFVVEGYIAVEVRRLNQHWQASSAGQEPVETLSIPRLNRLGKLLDSFGPPMNDESWYVIPSFKRPQLTRGWEVVLRDKLQTFSKGEIQNREVTLRIDDHFKVRLIRTSQPGASTFILGGSSDFDTGGWVIPELEKNLAICVAEKTDKIAAYRKNYPEWWLVLVDHIMAGTPETVRVEHNWDKVLVIHPRDYGQAYEVPNSKPGIGVP